MKNIRNNQSNIETKKKNEFKKWKTEKENAIWFRNQQFWGLCNYLIKIDKVDSTAQHKLYIRKRARSLQSVTETS